MSASAPVSQDWQPPEVDSSDLRYSVTSTFLEEFVKSHTIDDVLRELVQNEYDAGGRSLSVAFDSDGLRIDGNGQTIDRGGWRRLSVMVGTGQVLGNGRDIPRKENGIGSKNHGLRSLFLIGDRVYVRSGGWQTVLDIHDGAFAEPRRDPASAGRPGAHIFVPYRASASGLLETYGSGRQERDLDRLATGLAPTLLKLAQPGARRSLNSVTVTSTTHDRVLSWRQKAQRLRRHSLGGIEVERTIAVRESSGSRDATRTRRIKEREYQRTLDIPADLSELPFPTYYRAPGGRVRIGASLTLKRGRVDVDGIGAFYAPLGFSNSATGCAVGINAPFQMDSDRSSVVDPDGSRWNEWLVEAATDFVLDLLTEDWLERFGASAYVALQPARQSSVPIFEQLIADGLRERPCWPTRARAKGSRHPLLQQASHLAPGVSPELDALLPDDWRLDPRLDDARVVELAVASGASRFTLNSAVRYRCAGEDETSLSTELDNDEANLYEERPEAVGELVFQERFAKAIERHRRQLTANNRSDLKNTAATLTAAGTLAAPADPLWVVDEGIWTVAPVADNQRLHRRLAHYGTMRRLCEDFDVSNWARGIAQKATEGDVQEEDREALYRYLLRKPDAIRRSAWPVVKAAPVFRDHRDAWVAATSLVDRRTVGASRLEASLSFPSREMARSPVLLRKVRIRTKLTGADLVRQAEAVVHEPGLAESFEQTLSQLRRLLTRPTIRKLRSIAFLRSTSGRLVAPEDVYVRTTRLQHCLGPDAEYAAGPHPRLHAQLGCRTAPRADDIGTYLASLRVNRRRPAAAEVIYPELLDALREEGDPQRFANEPILFVKGDWHAPSDVLVGRRYQRAFLGGVPLVAGDRLDSVYVGLGANAEPTTAQWVGLFAWFDERSQNGLRRIPPPERRALRSAYARLPALPPGVPDHAQVLLDTEGRLHSKAEVRARRYLIDDDPYTTGAVRDAQLPIAFADVSDQASREFLRASGVLLLTEARQEVRVTIGLEQPTPALLRPRDILDRLHRRSFASAVHAVARATAANTAATEEHIAAILGGLRSVSVVSEIKRTYRVGGYAIGVDSDVAIDRDRVVLRPPGSTLDLYRRLAQAVSSIAETSPTAQASLADSTYFLLVAESPLEQERYLAERGIVWRPRGRRKGSGSSGGAEGENEREQIAGALTAGLLEGGKDGKPSSAKPASDGDKSDGKPRPPTPLPPIGKVSLQEAGESDWQPTERETGGGGGGGGIWKPRTAEQQAADRALGLRGEQLIYREEVKRVRALGFPKSRVVWVSRSNPGANHDIRSVDSDGVDLWIEVKATTGRHGQFDWPRGEFELAMAERDRYVLYRVYEADTTQATFRSQRDPVGAILAGEMKLDVSGLAAEMAPLSRPNS